MLLLDDLSLLELGLRKKNNPFCFVDKTPVMGVLLLQKCKKHVTVVLLIVIDIYFMSGHSKWSKIQHKKGKNDKARGNLFTKLSRAITLAAQQGGGDIDMNFSLRLAVQKGKVGNLPKDNITRAIKRGTGELKDGAMLTEALYEGFGPSGVAFLVETVSDNKNRTVSEVKHAFSKYGGSLGANGSVQWQFDRLGVIRVRKELIDGLSSWDDVELAFIDAGAKDIKMGPFGVEVYVEASQFQTVLGVLKTVFIEPDESGMEWIAKETVSCDEATSAKVESLYDALDVLDDVKAVHTNEA